MRRSGEGQVSSEGADLAVHCVIHTPLAYLCLREYLARYPYRERYLYVLATSRAAYDGIVRLQEEDDWTGIHPLSRGRTNLPLDRLVAPFRLSQARWRLGRRLAGLGDRDEIVLSHLNNPFARFVVERRRDATKPVTVVDDGTTTLFEFGALTRRGSLTTKDYSNRGNNWNAQFERLLFSEAPIRADDVRYFSFWPLSRLANINSPDILAENDFSHLRKSRVNSAPLPNVYFVGQPFVRRQVLDASAYAQILERIVDHYARQNISMVYFPHRNEDRRLLPQSLEVRAIDRPFELYLRDAERLPQRIAGFYSNCLMTTKHLFADTIEHELFWGFADLSPEKTSSDDVIRMFESEVERLPAITINRALTI